MTDDYHVRVAQQIAQYADVQQIHDLPPIYHVWSEEYVAPGLKEVFGVSSVTEFYAAGFRRAQSQGSAAQRVLSIGCGDGSEEIKLIEHLAADGGALPRIVCADLSPILLQRLEEVAARRGLAAWLEPVVTDLNDVHVPGPFDLIMAHHSLHHIVELEKLFEFCCQSLTASGVLATSDMIGRNGHMRWPEAEAILRAVWPVLSEDRRYDRQLRRVSEQFVNHDCSLEGFEGIRAQDILPLLRRYFSPTHFLGFGGFIDVFVDRSFGPAYDPGKPEDVAFVRMLADLNDILLDAGVITPTIMFGWFGRQPSAEVHYRGRSSEQSVRRLADPAWVRQRASANGTGSGIATHPD
jgi:SAM-dependent methyltransferase